MPPDAPPALRPLAEEGDLLAGRYLLLSRLPGPPGAVSSVWRATDQVLARRVAVRLLAAREQPATAFLQAAARAGSVDNRTLARVYDAAVEPRRHRPSLAYVIAEWVEGEPLSVALARGPVPPPVAVELAVQAARALADAHELGAAHGRLHPGNAFLTPAGQLRLTDAEVAAAVRRPGTAAGDVRDLAALLHAMLTATWPATATSQPGGGLPAAAPHDRAGVPAALDRLLDRALADAATGGPPPAGGAEDLLDALLALDLGAPARLRRRWWRRRSHQRVPHPC